jgi:hypothetical protein
MSLRDKVEWLFPFESMQVGDRGAKRSGIRVKTQVIIEDNLMGVRTWRVD